MYVKDVMSIEPYMLHEDDTILSASKFMKQERIRNMPVVDRSNKLVGLITLREIIETMFKNPDKILVKNAMIRLEQVKSVMPDTPLKGAIEVMLVNKYGCLPVLDDKGKLIGMLTEAYLLKTLYEVSTLPSQFFQVKTEK